ncbi:hypothetical protein HDV57DRAFT_38142 [Trichoderma longibrachiatum]|uniref:Uncharacterized protein n=1 Tax=Trichoderma longibrachiatum ATCC 18648 TaxID=983965 RepID=A0A2T4CHJ7_TRILO|nr:hypothetical protein M440DRAFT_75249 [Trichoderma longibrachiatum ATCC 18648]
MVVCVLLHGSFCCLLLAARHLGSSAKQDELLQSLRYGQLLRLHQSDLFPVNDSSDGGAFGRIIDLLTSEGMSTRVRRTEVLKGVGSTCLLTSLRSPKLAAVFESRCTALKALKLRPIQRAIAKRKRSSFNNATNSRSTLAKSAFQNVKTRVG